ncbi:MAG: hypothetical protein HY860_01365 [Chlamydiales bacterium]|nr:hypothetical protein [Chlamydiales bacterium]
MRKLMVFFVIISCYLQGYEEINCLSFSGSGSHLFNLYIAQLLDTDINVRNKKGEYKYTRLNQYFQLSYNPNYPPFYRTHFIETIKTQNPDDILLILLLRDYKECFFHQIKNGQILFGRYKINRHISIFNETMKQYFKDLNFFHQWQGENKIIIYYEDLITTPSIALAELAQHLQMDATQLENCIEKVNQIKNDVFKIYPGAAPSRGKDIHFHAKKHNKELMKVFDLVVQQSYDEFCQTYLKRYIK